MSLRYLPYVDPLAELDDDDPSRFDEAIAKRLMENRGPALSVNEINAAIEDILGTDVPLRAVERDGHIFLDDGVNHTVDGDNLSRNELLILCHEWLVFVGGTSEYLKDFID